MRNIFVGLIVATLVAFASPSRAAVVISEFLAQNDGGLRDADGDTPDWIELHNTGPSAVNLAGWHLTDNATNLTKWTFPATNIASGGFMVVFASGKNRATNGVELHTNFQLDQSSGYVALVQADGVTIASSITYSNQRAKVSFGVGASNTTATVVASNANARWLIPSNNSLGLTWTSAGFDDSTWTTSAQPLRYDFVASGGGISLDFNARSANTPAQSQSGFDTFIIGGASGAQSGAITRTYGGMSVTLSPSASGLTYDDRVRTSPVNGGALTTASIFQDFVFSPFNSANNGTNGIDILVSGLSPGSNYLCRIWSFDSGSATANRISDWYANGALVVDNYAFIGTTLPANDNVNQLSFTATATNTGGILISGRRDTSSLASQPSVFLNALQITPVASPLVTNGNVAALAGRNSTLYSRSSFVISNAVFYDTLKLRIRYDDGFVAYVNGIEVARRNAPANVDSTSNATATNAASVFEEIVLPGSGALLVNGTNVLAIQALNVATNDSDFYLQSELVAVHAANLADRYFAPPSPGAENDTGFAGIVADTKFSVDRGFYDAPFSLSITCSTAGATIYVTTNGSAPSPTNGFVFASPINISGQSFVRAAAYVPNFVPSDIDTHTYIFLRDVLRQSNSLANFPTTWQGSYPADYEMDSNIVNHPYYGPTLSNDLRSIPVLSIVTEHDGLWGPTRGIYNNPTSLGDAWVRSASVELISPKGTNGKTEFHANCALKIEGNASRDNARTPKHSFKLQFKSDFGASKLRYDWFSGNGNDFDNIVLRAAGFVDGWPSRYSDTSSYSDGISGAVWKGLRYRPETSTYLRDIFVKDSHHDMGWTVSRSDWVHLYINGLYWGIYNPSERIDSSFTAEHLGGWESDWDVLVGDDALFNAAVSDGSKNDWNALIAIVNAGIASEAAYAQVTNLVDVDSLIDYFLLHFYVEAEDWPNHNWYAVHRHANPTNGLPATKWQFLTWDQEVSLDRNIRRDRTGVNNADTPAIIYSKLHAWPEFNRYFGDRIQKHLFNGGALMPSNNIARFAARAASITNAINGESARWGDAREFTIGSNPGTGATFTRNEWWVPELQKLWTNFFPALHDLNISRFRAAGLYPNVTTPLFSQFGGAVTNGFALTITHTNPGGAQIYFTTDGSDPRVYGSGAVAPTAVAYGAPIPINAPTLVRARLSSGIAWGALVEAMFFPPQDLSKLALTEIMYSPPNVGLTNGDEFEFLELKNYGTNMLNLSGLTFTDAIQFTFTNGTLLAPGQFFVVVRNAAAFASKYPGVTINGVYTGKLDNGGEKLTLSHALGATIFSVTFDDTAPWPTAADGYGFSAVPKIPGVTQAPDDGSKWRASAVAGGSPGADDPTPNIAPIVINEVLTHTFAPALDRIELFNPTATNVNIGGWFLTDDHDVAKKFRITNGTVIPANGFIVFDETQFNATPGTNNSFSLNSHGDQIYLFSGDANTNLTGYSHGFSFGGAQSSVSFGRYVNSVGDEQFPAQVANTFNAANSGPRVAPVIVNEIHYHPALGGDEFVELKNITSTNVPLFDPAAPTNYWRLEGLNFSFPPMTLPPNGFVVLVATNVSYFRTKYSVPTSVLILTYSGNLQSSGERLELTRPDFPDTNGVSHITVDNVRYNDKLPWPPAADGSGPSLQRKNSAQYGDDPISWQVAPPTPGRENSEADSDADGIPDSWEIATGTDPLVPDANNDEDGDGHSNYQEYLAGTNPHDPDSTLRLKALLNGNSTQLQFGATSNRTFAVQFKDALGASLWSPLTNIPAAPQNRVISINDARTNSSRFYRVTAP